MYFEDEDASALTDVERESTALTAWWAEYSVGGDVAAKRAELLPYLAEDRDEADDFEDDDGEVFVEVELARFLRALDLPVPADLEQ